MGVESGTCNVCSTPCQACIQNNLNALNKSKEDSGSSCHILLKEEDGTIRHANEMPLYRNKFYDELQHTGREARNLPSVSSCHDSYSQNAGSKVSTCRESEDVGMHPPKLLRETIGNQYLKKESIATDSSIGVSIKQDEAISVLTEDKDSIADGHYSMEVDKKISINSSMPNDVLVGKELENIVKVETTDCFPGSDNKESPSNRSRQSAHPNFILKECDDKSNLFSPQNGYADGKSSLRTQLLEDKNCEEKSTAGPCLTDVIKFDQEISSKVINSTTTNNDSCLVDESIVLISQVTDGGNQEKEPELFDVNICDICGDVGRGYLLAICSNCGDGAEHIYCMRKKLQKVPEGNWLCEECQLKKQTERKNADYPGKAMPVTMKCNLSFDREITKRDRSEKVLEKVNARRSIACSDTKADKQILIKQKLLNTTNLKSMPKLDMKINQDRKKALGPLQSTKTASKRPVVDQEDMSPNSRRPLYSSGKHFETSSTRKRLFLSHETSFRNIDANKERTSDVSFSNGAQNAKKTHGFSRTQSVLGSYLSKVPSAVRSPHGFLSRSSSFDANPTSKVKQYTEKNPFNRELTRESSINEKRKFESPGSKSIGTKTQLIEDPISVIHNKKIRMIETKINPTTVRLPMPSLTNARIHGSEIDMKTTLRDVKSSYPIESKTLRLNKGSSYVNDTGNTGSLKQFEDPRPCLKSRACDIGTSSSTDKLSNKSETVQNKNKVKNAKSVTCDDEPKEYSGLKTTWQSISNPSVQSCSVDKHKSSYLKSCSENNSKDENIKINKWKDPVSKTTLDAQSHINNNGNSCIGQSNQLEDLPPISEDTMHLVSTSKANATPSCAFNDVQTIKASYSPKALDLNDVASASNDIIKQASRLAYPHMSPTFPNIEYIWQGCFQVLNENESESAFYDGIQAHLSTSVSPKAHDITTKFPNKIMLEEAPWISSWPLQCQGISPVENNIAVFFFAKDIVSYERSYGKLLEKMIKNDLSLKGIIDGAELLIFPSTKLPVQSQRWNMMFFLWGMFKARRKDKSELVYHQKSFLPDLNLETETQDIPRVLKPVISNPTKLLIAPNSSSKLPSCAISSACMETAVTLSPNVEDITCMHRSTDHNSFSTSNSYDSRHDDQNSSFLSSSSSGLKSEHPNQASNFCSNTSKLSNMRVAHPKSMFQMTDTLPCSEMKYDSTYRKHMDSNVEEKSAIWLDQLPSSKWQNKASLEAQSFSIKPVSQPNSSPKSSKALSMRLTNEEKPFFPVVPNTRSEDAAHVLSSKDEYTSNPDKPNLELALWNKNKSDADEDEAASLSLSLAIPTPKKDHSKDANAPLQKDSDSNAPLQKDSDANAPLQKDSDANSPLLLFGRSVGI